MKKPKLNPNIRPIGKQEIKRIFAGNEFLERLTQAAVITWETGHESGFSVVRDIYQNKVMYGSVVGFDWEDGFDNEGVALDPTKSIQDRFWRSMEPVVSYKALERDEIYPVADLHFHPFPYTFMPSIDDINHFLGWREEYLTDIFPGFKINHYPVDCIASIPRSERTVELLLLQETGEEPLGEKNADILHAGVENNPAFVNENGIIARLFSQQRSVQALMLSYDYNKSRYHLRKRQYRQLGRFASWPRLVKGREEA